MYLYRLGDSWTDIFRYKTIRQRLCLCLFLQISPSAIGFSFWFYFHSNILGRILPPTIQLPTYDITTTNNSSSSSSSSSGSVYDVYKYTITTGILIYITSLLCTILCINKLDRWGRRYTLILCYILACIGWVGLAVLLHIIHNTSYTTYITIPYIQPILYYHTIQYTLYIIITIYLINIAVVINCTIYTIISEIFPLRFRSKLIALSIAVYYTVGICMNKHLTHWMIGQPFFVLTPTITPTFTTSITSPTTPLTTTTNSTTLSLLSLSAIRSEPWLYIHHNTSIPTSNNSTYHSNSSVILPPTLPTYTPSSSSSYGNHTSIYNNNTLPTITNTTNTTTTTTYIGLLWSLGDQPLELLFSLFAGVSLIYCIVVTLALPETSALMLEEVEVIYSVSLHQPLNSNTTSAGGGSNNMVRGEGMQSVSGGSICLSWVDLSCCCCTWCCHTGCTGFIGLKYSSGDGLSGHIDRHIGGGSSNSIATMTTTARRSTKLYNHHHTNNNNTNNTTYNNNNNNAYYIPGSTSTHSLAADIYDTNLGLGVSSPLLYNPNTLHKYRYQYHLLYT